MTRKCLTFAILALFPFIGLAQDGPQLARRASFVELIANPSKFDGQLVLVTAFLGLDPPDGNMLYFHKEDYENGLVQNAVAIEVSKQMWADREKLDMNYVSVVGVFKSSEKTHSRYAEIMNVRTCSLWSQADNPIRRKLPSLHHQKSTPQ